MPTGDRIEELIEVVTEAAKEVHIVAATEALIEVLKEEPTEVKIEVLKEAIKAAKEVLTEDKTVCEAAINSITRLMTTRSVDPPKTNNNTKASHGNRTNSLSDHRSSSSRGILSSKRFRKTNP